MNARTTPKERLSKTEVKVLELFSLHNIDSEEKGQTMQQILAFYAGKWLNANFDGQKMSRDLKILKDNKFLQTAKGQPVMIDRSQQSYTWPKGKKARFWLSKQVLNSEILIDDDRWIMVNGVYIASEVKRARAKAREKAQSEEENDTI